MRIDIITVFPEMFRGFLGESILSRAVRMGKVFIRTVDLRDFARDQRRTVDDKPYSGGPGMLMRPDVWTEAVEAVRTPGARIILTTPAGAPNTTYGRGVLSCRPPCFPLRTLRGPRRAGAAGRDGRGVDGGFRPDGRRDPRCRDG